MVNTQISLGLTEEKKRREMGEEQHGECINFYIKHHSYKFISNCICHKVRNRSKIRDMSLEFPIFSRTELTQMLRMSMRKHFSLVSL